MHYLFTAILICDNCHFSMCVTQKMAESNKKSKRKSYSSSRKDVGGHKSLLSKQANEYMSLHSLFTPQSSQSDSKSGADNTNSDIPSNISDTDVAVSAVLYKKMLSLLLLIMYQNPSHKSKLKHKKL